MLWPVELDSARDPGSQQTHERRLNYSLSIKEIVAVSFVLTYMDAPSDFWKHHQTDVLVFNENGVISFFLLIVCYSICKWIWIHSAAAALVNAFLQEHRIFIGWLLRIGRDRYSIFPDLNGFGG